jgi:hypothetical protein
VLFEVVRFKDPKDFRQRRPLGNGIYAWDLKGVTPILYKLPDLLAADPAEIVWIPEGEKDVDNLWRRGLVSTCNPMGALKWRDRYSDDLKGRHCVVIPDNDPPEKKYPEGKGQRHAQEVARSLHGKAASVKVVELPGVPEKGDVTDFLNVGGTVDQLRELAAKAPEWTPGATAPVSAADWNSIATEEEQTAGPRPARSEPSRNGPVAPPAQWPTLPVGICVMCLDREPPNFGFVLEDLGDRARLRWESQGGHVSTGILHKSQLRRQDGSELTAEVCDDDSSPIPTSEWPDPPDPAAFHGLAGEIVNTLAPETEADPIALLVQLLVAFGSIVGRRAYARVGPARHFTNEYAVLVGETSAARKGQSWSEVYHFIAEADPGWRDRRILSGLSSGEGVIYNVRDAKHKKQAVKQKGRVVDYQRVVADEGESDKRLLILETEFGGVFKVLDREGNKLSAVLRDGWDSRGILATLTQGSPHRATNSHISIIGHITAVELIRLLSECDQANGFANRFMWICCRRSKLLPFGGRVPEEQATRLRDRLREAIDFGQGVEEVLWTDDAKAVWESEYERLTAARPGVLGMVASRAEAHCLRLSVLYALLDRSCRIEPEHVRAAVALWDYCERSARYIFGDKLGDKDAEKILASLRAAPEGLSRTAIRRDVFSGNKSAEAIASKLAILLSLGLARSESVETGGRPAELWFAVDPQGYAKNALNAQSPPPADQEQDSLLGKPLGVKSVKGVGVASDNSSPDREVFEL